MLAALTDFRLEIVHLTESLHVVETIDETAWERRASRIDRRGSGKQLVLVEQRRRRQ